jgi:hypothetical protein
MACYENAAASNRVPARTGAGQVSNCDADILAWSEHQAELLRRLAAGERVDDQVDWANFIEDGGEVGRD